MVLFELIKNFLIGVGFPLLKLFKFIFNFKFKFKVKFKKCHFKIVFTQKRYRFKKTKWKIFTIIIIFILLITASVGFYRTIILDLPNINDIYNPPKLSTKIFDRNGILLYKFYDGENRSWVTLDKIPKTLIDATIAVEDKEFYKHHGLSLKGIISATWYNFTHKDKVRGGSTITQQLVKNVFLTREKTWKRKIKEAIITLLIEKRLTKNEILERYFNQVSYGGEVYGVQEAAQRYFDKNVWEVNESEATYLAGLPAAPTVYSSFDLARERQMHVINEMISVGFIDQTKADEIKNQKIVYTNGKGPLLAEHFVFYVKDYVENKFGFFNFERQGLSITTSLDLNKQKMAEDVTKTEINAIKKLNISNGASLVINVKTGDILAMVGSVNDHFNVTTALRQPGSSIKPINYLLALQKGWTMNSIIDDNPVVYPSNGSGQKPYAPQNYTGKYLGRVTLKTALASSLNVPSVKLLEKNGVNNMIDLAESMGINSWHDRKRFGLSLALGSGEVKMTELAQAYSIFANLGDKVLINPILRIENYLGENIYEKQIEKKKVVEGKYAYLINNILSDNEARTPIFGPNSLLKINNKTVAVKTGTTNNLRDNWCIGWTPSYLVATWVGNNDNKPMSYVASGISGATPIWNKIMNALIEKMPDEIWPIPEGVYKANVCGKEDYFVDGTEKSVTCPTKSATSTASPQP